MRTRLLLFAIIAFNLAVKLLWLDVRELAHDEPFTVYWSQQPFSLIWEMLRTENNPPLYLLLIKAWSTIVPFEAAWLRVPSALFSALTVWPLFLLGQRLGGTRVALTASLLFTLNDHQFGFAHEVRAYALFALLAATAMWLLWRAKDRSGHPRALIALGLVNAIMVYTHFFGWLAIGIQGLCVLLLSELRPVRRGFLLALSITALLFAPYALVFVERASASIGQGTWLGPPVPEEIYNMIWRWSNAPVLAVIVLLIILTACWRDRLRDPGLRLALLWTIVPLLGMYAVSYVVPIFLDRYLVYAAPGSALLVALSVRAIRVPAGAEAILGSALILGTALTFTPWKAGVYRPSRVVAQVDAWQPGPVLIQPDWYDLTYLWAQGGDRECFRALPEERGWCMGKGFVWTMNEGGELPIDPAEQGTVLLVDASGAPRTAHSTRERLAAWLPRVDSVQADHRVWVYRFRR